MPYKVLVVDDSKLARMAVAKVLNGLRPDWTRVEAASADEALALAIQGDFDVALVDFNMPERDGLHLAADLKSAKPRIELALVSANHQKEIVDRARAVGASFLGKPLTEPVLREFVERVEANLKSAR